jgi:hypothetical protein
MRAHLLHYCDGACQRHHSANRSNEKFGTLSHWRQRFDKLTSLPVPEKPVPDLIRGGHRFSEKGMRKLRKLECIPVHLDRNAL